MHYQQGLIVAIERYNDNRFIAISLIGHLTARDLNMIANLLDAIPPALPAPITKCLIDTTQTGKSQWRAVWDDLRLALKHGRSFRHIAIVGSRSWRKISAQLGALFMEANIYHFDDREAAIEWLAEKPEPENPDS